jgi:Right handed beta helix region
MKKLIERKARRSQKTNALGLILLMSLGFACQIMALTSWTAPAGIPTPDFGITNSHWMYTNTLQKYDFGSGAVPYPTTTNGPYTHYVDNGALNATDSANPYGSLAKPRLTFPTNLPPGSVVEVHGGPYTFRNFSDKMAFIGYGTPLRPIFLRGSSNSDRPTFSKDLVVFGTYLIAENLDFAASRISVRPDLSSEDAHHISFRALNMIGTSTETVFSAVIGGIGRWADPFGPQVSNVVIFSNMIRDYGQWQQSAPENDYVGVAVDGYNASDIWILNNDIHHLGGDSVRVGSNPTAYPYTSRRVYVGGNHLHDNHENALDIKGIYDVVVSQNDMHGFLPSSSDPGGAIPIHYGCTNIWIVNNNIHNAAKGIICSDAGDIYAYGNIIYNVGEAFEFWTANQIHILGNTIFRMGSGISDLGAAAIPHPLLNNIFTGLTNSSTGFHIKLATSAASVSAMDNNLIYESNGSFRVYWGGKTYTTLAGFVSGTGKGGNSLALDPQFIDPTLGNFQLKNTSPARDAGAALSAYTALFKARFGTSLGFDIIGGLRPQGISWDIGACETSGSVKPGTPKNLRLQ